MNSSDNILREEVRRAFPATGVEVMKRRPSLEDVARRTWDRERAARYELEALDERSSPSWPSIGWSVVKVQKDGRRSVVSYHETESDAEVALEALASKEGR